MTKTLIGNVRGPQGEPGPSGAVGQPGPQGQQGERGERGAIWHSGTGITGTSVTAEVFTGSGITEAALNDYYLNTSTSNVYRCTLPGAANAAKWVYVGCIKGLKGDTGAKGEKGERGEAGPQGPAGTVSNLSAQPVIFTSASDKSEILSGETISTLFGKLKKNQAVSDSYVDEIRSKMLTLEQQQAVDSGTSGVWKYVKSNDGTFTAVAEITNANTGNLSGSSPIFYCSLPILTPPNFVLSIDSAVATMTGNGGAVSTILLRDVTKSSITLTFIRFLGVSSSIKISYKVKLTGTWK